MTVNRVYEVSAGFVRYLEFKAKKETGCGSCAVNDMRYSCCSKRNSGAGGGIVVVLLVYYDTGLCIVFGGKKKGFIYIFNKLCGLFY